MYRPAGGRARPCVDRPLTLTRSRAPAHLPSNPDTNRRGPLQAVAAGGAFVDAKATATLRAACVRYRETLQLRDTVAYALAHARDPLSAAAKREACVHAMSSTAGTACDTDVIMRL